MGTWGTSLYANDTTADVRDTYMGFLKEQLSNEEALERTMETFQELIGDEVEEPLFWYALAETQWKVGRLTSDVKEKALSWIAESGGIVLWEESGTGSAGWKKTLDKLKNTLESPMRSEKKVRKPVVINHNLWETGDVYAYQFHKEESKTSGTYGKYIVMQKIGASPLTFKREWITQDALSRAPLTEPVFMLIHTYDKLFDYLPTMEDLEDVRLLPVGEPTISGEYVALSRQMELYKKRDYPEKYLFYLGKAPIFTDNRIWTCNTTVFWDMIEGVLNNSLSKWKNVEFWEVEEGVYNSKPIEQ